MILAGTALLVHVLAKHGMLWEGAAAAWLMAAGLDTAILFFLIYSIFK